MKLSRLFYVGLLHLFLVHSGIAQPAAVVGVERPITASLSENTDSFFTSAADDKSPVIIADILITGYKKTKPYIIEREIPFRIGNHLMRGELPAKIELARQQLMNTALFVDVEVKIDRQVDDLVFINVVVKERWYFFPLPYFKIVDRNFNQWWVEHKRSLKRVNYGLKLMHYNFSGRADQLHLYLINGYTQQASFRYEQPAADKSLKFGFEVGFSYGRNKEVNFNTDSNKQQFYKEDRFISESFSSDITFSYRPKIRTRHYLRFSYHRAKVDQAIITLNPSFFPEGSTTLSYPEISYSISHHNVDYIPYPSKGITFGASLAKRGFSKEMNLWQLNASASYTIPVSEKSQLYLQATGTLKLPLNQPYYNKRLFGYGDLYMRGLEYYVVDGTAGFVGRATARRELFNFNIKPPIKVQGHEKIPFRILVKAYGDLGYAYDGTPTGHSMLSNKLLRSWGVGIDIVSFYDFVIRFEYSFNQLDEHDLFLHSRSDF